MGTSSDGALIGPGGADSGCVLTTAPPALADTPFFPGNTVVTSTVTCTHGWAEQKSTQRMAVVTGGERGPLTLWDLSRTYSDNSADPVTYVSQHAFVPCAVRAGDDWALPLGENTIIDGTNFSVSAAPSDGQPFTATVEQELTVTCTEQDRATAWNTRTARAWSTPTELAPGMHPVGEPALDRQSPYHDGVMSNSPGWSRSGRRRRLALRLGRSIGSTSR